MKIPSAKLFLRSFRNLFLSNSETTNVRQIWTPEFCEDGTHGIPLYWYILKDPPTGKWVEGKRGEHDSVASFFWQTYDLEDKGQGQKLLYMTYLLLVVNTCTK